MDLAPSAYAPQSNSKHARRANLGSREKSRKKTAGQSLPPGAIRRTEAQDAERSSHFGKLATAGIVIAGTLIWTSGASEPFAPFTAGNQKTVQAAIAPPAFFFDDDADALNRISAPTGVLNDDRDNAPAEQRDWMVNERNGAADINLVDVVDMVDAVEMVDDSDIVDDVIAMTDTQRSPQHQNATPVPHITLPSDPSFINIEKSSIDDAEQPSVSEPTLNTIFPGLKTATTPTIASNTTNPKPEIVTVALGDTLSGILNDKGLKIDRMRELLTNEIVKEHLSDIDVGQTFELTRDSNGSFRSLSTRVGNSRRVNIKSTESGFEVTTNELPIEVRSVATSGRIDQSLYLAAEKANLKQSTIMELADIFQWELDFARDIRQGDRFSLVYDRQYREGEYIGDGDILAAEFVRGGKSYKAIRFTTDEGVTGYYSPEGNSMRRTFMRHPVDVVRITSRFNPNRLHPVLHQIRAHRGVDYGSPHGSPIYATADGRVTYSGNKNAYGKTVVLKHGEKFSTLYAHMSRISSKSQVGKRVKQGDVIGYVGKTGRVTGTHLHYEFRVNGVQIDPLKVELPAAAPIDSKYLQKLKSLSNEMSVLMSGAFEEADKQIAKAPDIESPLTDSQHTSSSCNNGGTAFLPTSTQEQNPREPGVC